MTQKTTSPDTPTRLPLSNYILMHKIRRIPAVIVQGRYDIVCPIETAHELR
ncbi:MAG: hypothetical protein HY052_08200 [Proteobacteria bacterium]|nr:hypothetical protein [Pseudomonadota bacterium]